MRVCQNAAPVSGPAASIAACNALVSSSVPFPFAPKSRTFSTPASAGKRGAATAIGIAVSAASAMMISRQLLCGNARLLMLQKSDIVIEVAVDHVRHRVAFGHLARRGVEVLQSQIAARQAPHDVGKSRGVTGFEQQA